VASTVPMVDLAAVVDAAHPGLDRARGVDRRDLTGAPAPEAVQSAAGVEVDAAVWPRSLTSSTTGGRADPAGEGEHRRVGSVDGSPLPGRLALAPVRNLRWPSG
jgi:hypothetical protein